MVNRKKEVSERKKYEKLRGLFRALFTDSTMREKDWKIVDKAVTQFQVSTTKIEKDHLIYLINLIREQATKSFLDKDRMSIRTIFAMIIVINILEHNNIITEKEYKKLGKKYEHTSIYEDKDYVSTMDIIENIGAWEEEILTLIKKVVLILSVEKNIDYYSIDSIVDMAKEFKDNIDNQKNHYIEKIEQVEEEITNEINNNNDKYFTSDGVYIHNHFHQRISLYNEIYDNIDFRKIMLSYKA